MINKASKRALIIFFIFYVLFGAVITITQERLIYIPGDQDFAACTMLESSQVIQNGTRMYVQDGEKGVVILYHGNAGSACDRTFYAEQFVAVGFGYIIPEYAGYSNDSTKPSHERIRNDVENVVSYLKEHPATTTVIVGESIGTGIASYHVSLAAPNALLLISPFDTLASVAQHQFWFYPARLLVNKAYDNVEFLNDYTGTVTILHGEADTLIPISYGKNLFESLTTPNKQFVSVPEAGHNDLFFFQKSYDTVRDVLTQANQ